MNLTSLMKRKSITQSALAAVLGVKQGTVSKYLNGHLRLKAEDAHRIGRHAGVVAQPTQEGSFDFKPKRKGA